MYSTLLHTYLRYFEWRWRRSSRRKDWQLMGTFLGALEMANLFISFYTTLYTVKLF